MEGRRIAGRGWARFLLAVACMAVVVGRGGAATEAGAPSASVDCTSTITSLIDCLSYVQNGSKVEKPEGGCCPGLKKVVKTQVSCLCEAFKSSADFAVAINITKALGLPAACGVSTPSVSKCKIPGLGTSPGILPFSSPSSSFPCAIACSPFLLPSGAGTRAGTDVLSLGPRRQSGSPCSGAGEGGCPHVHNALRDSPSCWSGPLCMPISLREP
ncbi:hypothetical protein Taro_046248 [Colocasia esculenta]|uniref:Bifunctional inhibitor/plant lipid transfer protein/seed storage helical domain-containing protein n=1 Tax=Colocasia esculenta TaxID=4460 RepID=A0A843WPC5_COLES|nr:hypothetical protein [Colocasia esculenta]